MQYIGQFGTYQRRVFFLLWLVSAAGGLAVVVYSFTGINLGFGSSHFQHTETDRSDIFPNRIEFQRISNWKDLSTKLLIIEFRKKGEICILINNFLFISAFVPKHRVRTECDVGDSYFQQNGR